MKLNRTILLAVAALGVFSSCHFDKHEDILFDTPFATVSDATKTMTKMYVDPDANNLLTELTISICVSNTYNSEPIIVSYELIPGDGLKEGVDYKVQPSTKSPVTFKPGTYDMPVRLIWMKNAAYDPEKDNTLTVRLTESSISQMVLGSPGEANGRREFIFIKQYV